MEVSPHHSPFCTCAYQESTVYEFWPESGNSILKTYVASGRGRTEGKKRGVRVSSPFPYTSHFCAAHCVPVFITKSRKKQMGENTLVLDFFGDGSWGVGK